VSDNKTLHPAVKPDMLVNSGALKLALNVLRRAGKNEVADELEMTAISLNSLPSDEAEYYRILAEKDLQIKQLEDRWKSANKMCTSYMNEFEKRGLVYNPI
jgi:hypothetical protein